MPYVVMNSLQFFRWLAWNKIRASHLFIFPLPVSLVRRSSLHTPRLGARLSINRASAHHCVIQSDTARSDPHFIPPRHQETEIAVSLCRATWERGGGRTILAFYLSTFFC